MKIVRLLRPFLTLWAYCLLTTPVTVASPSGEQTVTSRPQATSRKSARIPADVGESTLGKRAEAQFATLERFEVFTFFRFADRLTESGIRFRHFIVDDAGKHYKMVHYDHGNAVAVADVDGDGWHDVYFTTQLGSNELWKNLGNGRFENRTGQAGVGLTDKVSVGAAFADVDNDGDPDLYVTTVKMGNVLFENLGEGRFRDVSSKYGVGHVGHSSGVVFFDYDRDARLDLYVTNVGVYTAGEKGRGGAFVGLADGFSGHLHPERFESSRLYANRGERFEDVTEKAGLEDTSWSGDATFTDLNVDGYPDLYVLNMQGDDHYYENQAGRTFSDKTAEHFPKTPWGTMGVKFFDYDNDGLIDLFLTDMHSDMSENIGPEREKLKSRMQWSDEHLQGGKNNVFGNAFYHNRGQDGFHEISDEIGAENYWPWGVSVADLNGDGYEDLFITSSMNYPFRYGVNSLLLNNGGKAFLGAEFLLEVEPRDNVVTPWFDLDCGGADRDHMHCQEGDEPEKGGEGGGAAVTILGTLGSRSAVIWDLDRDGDLDIVTNEFNSAPQVLISDLAEQTEIHYLEVVLVGTASNRDGLGARVEVFAGADSWVKVHDGKSGYLSQSSLPLYFGLAEHPRAERVEVLWPSGRRQLVGAGIPRNGRLEIVEDEDTPGPDGRGINGMVKKGVSSDENP